MSLVALLKHHTCVRTRRQRILDFGYLSLGELLDAGAAARVFKGKYRRTPVAVKVFTPMTVTVNTVRLAVTTCTRAPVRE